MFDSDMNDTRLTKREEVKIVKQETIGFCSYRINFFEGHGESTLGSFMTEEVKLIKGHNKEKHILSGIKKHDNSSLYVITMKISILVFVVMAKHLQKWVKKWIKS